MCVKQLSQKEYKQKHDNIAIIVHLELRPKLGLVGQVKWYKHKPPIIVQNDMVKILWNFKQTITSNTKQQV